MYTLSHITTEMSSFIFTFFQINHD